MDRKAMGVIHIAFLFVMTRMEVSRSVHEQHQYHSCTIAFTVSISGNIKIKIMKCSTCPCEVLFELGVQNRSMFFCFFYESQLITQDSQLFPIRLGIILIQ